MITRLQCREIAVPQGDVYMDQSNVNVRDYGERGSRGLFMQHKTFLNSPLSATGIRVLLGWWFDQLQQG